MSEPIWAGVWSKSTMSAWVVKADRLRANAASSDAGGSPVPPALRHASDVR